MTTADSKTDRERLAEELEQFIAFRNGCDQVFRHWLGFKYTDGVKYVADQAGAHWLIDAIGSYQPSSKLRSNPRLQEFQLWELKVDLEAKTAVLTLREDTDAKPTVTQKIEYTNFPLPSLKLYLENGLLLLPCER